MGGGRRVVDGLFDLITIVMTTTVDIVILRYIVSEGGGRAMNKYSS